MKQVKRFIAQAPYTAGTKLTYTLNLGYFAEWWNGRPASEVTPDDFLEFLDTKPHWSDSQRHTSLAAFKAYVRKTYGELDQDNRTREILLFKVRREQPDEQRILLPTEIDKLIQVLDLGRPADVRNLVMLLVSLDCRLRASEICGLKIDQIDFETNTVVTRRKGGKRHAGLFGEYTRTYLKAWLVERRGFAAPQTQEAFVNVQGQAKGESVKPAHWRVICRRWAIRAGIPHFSPHAICRSFAYFARLLGSQTHVTAQAGGWEDESMVLLYDRRLRVQEFEEFLPTKLLNGVKGEPPGSSPGAR